MQPNSANKRMCHYSSYTANIAFATGGLLLLIWILPLIFRGNFYVDDWGVPYAAISHHSFWATYKSYFPLWSNRPLAPLIMSLTGRVFQQNPAYYYAFNSALWVTFLVLLGLGLRSILSFTSIILFVVLSTFNPIGNTAFFSPAVQFTAILSLLLWSVSFWIQQRFLGSRPLMSRLLIFVALLVAILIYEIFIPFLVISVSLILARRDSLRFKVINITSIVMPIFIGFLYQRFIIPHYMPTFSRLSAQSLHESALGSASWLSAVFLQAPIVLCDVPLLALRSRILSYPITVGIVTLLMSVLYCAFFGSKRSAATSTKVLLSTLFIALFSNIFLYLLSGAQATVIGYANRGLLSTWILGVLFLVTILEKLRNPLISTVVAFFAITSVCSSYAQLCQHLRNGAIRSESLNEIRKLISTVPEAEHRSYLIGVVPQFGRPNLADIVIFDKTWDFGIAVALTTNNYFTDGAAVNCYKALRYPLFYLDGDYIVVDGGWKKRWDEVAFYIYSDVHPGIIITPKTRRDADLLLTQVKTDHLHEFSFSPAQNYNDFGFSRCIDNIFKR